MRLRWGLWLQLCQSRFAGHNCLLWYSTMKVSLGSAPVYPKDCVVIALSLSFMLRVKICILILSLACMFEDCLSETCSSALLHLPQC